MLSRREAMALAGASVLAGCARPARGVIQRSETSAKVLLRSDIEDISSLDPHKAASATDRSILGDLHLGLIAPDAAGRPVAGAAQSWTPGADGLRWRFDLREHLYSNGASVRADDFVFSLRRLFAPESLARYASVFGMIENAREVLAGRVPPARLGVSADGPRSLVLRLEHPAPYLPELMAAFTCYVAPLSESAFAAGGRANFLDPASIPTNGPYAAAEWRRSDHLQLRKNAHFFQHESVAADEVRFYPSPDQASAVRLYRSGRRDLSMWPPEADIATLRQLYPDHVKLYPLLAVTYLAFNMRAAPFNNSELRRALSLSVDPDVIVRSIRAMDETKAESFNVPWINYLGRRPRLDFAGRSQQDRLAEATALMARHGFSQANPLRVNMRYPAGGFGAVMVALQAMLKRAGIECALLEQDTVSHFREVEAGRFEVSLGYWGAHFNDPVSLLQHYTSDAGNANEVGYANPRYDALLRRSESEADAARRSDLLASAEQILLDDLPLFPMYHQNGRALVSPHIDGFQTNPLLIHPSRWMSIRV